MLIRFNNGRKYRRSWWINNGLHAYKMTDEFKSGNIVMGLIRLNDSLLHMHSYGKSHTDEEMKNRIANDSHSPECIV